MIEAKYYETYYCCNAINNLLHYQFEFIRNLHVFYEDELPYLLQPFKKYSAFHSFIEFVVRDIIHEQTLEIDIAKRIEEHETFRRVPSVQKELDSYRLPIESALSYHEIDHESFLEFLAHNDGDIFTANKDDIYDYLSELTLTGEIEQLGLRITKEVFHVLFQNRHILLLFSDFMAGAVESNQNLLRGSEAKDLLEQNGTLKRQRIPCWAKRAVFFRDRGRCVLCGKDLSNLVNLDNQENYDHIVPLARYGLNDVSNIQLLCRECNQLEKADKAGTTSLMYQSWYDYEDEE